MVPNPEGFVALGGHAVTTERAARRLVRRHEEHAAGWRAGPTEAVVLGPSRGQRLLARTGDLLLAAGGWLKTRSSHASLQPR